LQLKDLKKVNSFVPDLYNIDKPLSYNQKFALAFHLKNFYTPEDLQKYEDIKKRYHANVNVVTILSLVNVVLVAAAWKKFLQLKTWQQVGVSVGIFYTSQFSGMWTAKREAEEFTTGIIEKYRSHIDDIKFDLPEAKEQKVPVASEAEKS